MSTVIQYKYDQKSNPSLVELESKNSASTSFLAMDLMGLSWIFNDDE